MNAYYLTPSQTSSLQLPNFNLPQAGLVFNSMNQPQLYMPLPLQQQLMNPQQVREMIQQVQPQVGLNSQKNSQQQAIDNANFDGLGRIQYPNGDFYEGHFKKGKMEGKGKLINARGDVYEGNFKNGFKHGHGIMKYRNGISSYDGQWYYNKIEGQGTLIDDFGNRYEGEFKDNMKNGIGKCFYANGMRFEGYWSNNIPEKGELFMKNGNHYEGEWRDDRFSGVGTIRYSNGDIYEGEWKEHLPHRYGKMLYRNGRVYNGEWFMGKKHGQGVMTYPNGDQYEGEWQSDQRQGFGMLKFVKGDVYEGEWFNDKMHGKGMLRHADESSYEGIWENGQKIEGQGVFKYANGNIAVRSNYNVNDKEHVIYNNMIQNSPHKFLEYRGSIPTAPLAIQGLPQTNPLNNQGIYRPRPLPLPMAGLQQLKSNPNNNSSFIQDSTQQIHRSFSQRRNEDSSLQQTPLKDLKGNTNTKLAGESNPYQENNRSKSSIRGGGVNIANYNSSNIFNSNPNPRGQSNLNHSYNSQAHGQQDRSFKGLSMIPTRPDIE